MEHMLKHELQVTILKGELTIYRFPPDFSIPIELYASTFFSVTRTDEELSVVCSSGLNLDSVEKENGWSCIKVLGPLDFSLTGILANISAILAEAKISIFAISTYDTDYILVKTEKLALSEKCLSQNGYKFV